MFTSIVVGTDGSASAKVAVERARELASRSGALLHLVTGQVAAGGRRAEAEGELRALADELEATGVSVKTHVESGRASAAILDLAERERADLVVVGGRGMQGARRVLGSVPNDVAHRASSAVLIVDSLRDEGSRWPGPVVVGADRSATAAEAVRQAAQLARLLGQPLHIVTGYKPLEVGPMPAADQLLDDLAFSARQAGTEVELHAVRGDGAAAILDVADSISAAVVAVGNRGMSGVSRLLGSVAHKVVHHAPCDAFVVHTT